ncbi:hypothetical protein DMB66_09900 [Actinoplanes sp. ATCC 53533]|uniref:hypothetical protein n=1 Tax=Actinoplanes sp. ATCC 53533 TaxID=1288362 RepID=UPI000F7B601A|nr:hypothetical protein [Actinoplanes sp. ATCC 53533]RSM70092.1 hypothetical protein DMB66_09900 [Actinoplanes sp. ATCC 53533]
MNDLEQLSVLDPAHGREPTAVEWNRANAVVDRIIDGRAVANTLPTRRPARRWVVGLAAAAAAAVAGVVVVPSLLPGTADRAFAAWTPVPGSLTGEQVMPQARRCAESGVGSGSGPVSPSDVVLAEQRGMATLLIQKRGAGLIECMIVDGESFAAMPLTEDAPPVPAKDTVEVATSSSVGDDDDQYSNIVGLAGPSVTGVDLLLADGRKIKTSFAGGLWAAWWPGPEGGEADTIKVVVHNSTGTATYRIGELY